MVTFAQYLENRISYSAVFLDQQSQDKLLNAIGDKVPTGWKTYARHMTINMGSLKDRNELGKTVELTASEIGISDMAIAVKVDGYPSKNNIPHVTVAANVIGGGKPVMSNNITDWHPIPPIKLNGTVSEA